MASIVNFDIKDSVLSINGNTFSCKSQGITSKRVNPIPLEHYEVFNTVADAETYASSNPVAYAGQQIVVVSTDGTKVQAYVVAGTEQTGGSWLIPLSQGANMSDVEITVWEDWTEPTV